MGWGGFKIAAAVPGIAVYTSTPPSRGHSSALSFVGFLVVV